MGGEGGGGGADLGHAVYSRQYRRAHTHAHTLMYCPVVLADGLLSESEARGVHICVLGHDAASAPEGPVVCPISNSRAILINSADDTEVIRISNNSDGFVQKILLRIAQGKAKTLAEVRIHSNGLISLPARSAASSANITIDVHVAKTTEVTFIYPFGMAEWDSATEVCGSGKKVTIYPTGGRSDWCALM